MGKPGIQLLSNLLRNVGTQARPSNCRQFSLVSQHTDKWMQDPTKKSPMELINEVPPIKVDGRIVACEGDTDPALGHPIEFICLDLDTPAICKYCGLRFVQNHHH
ncbi:hypothetical protein H6P81_007321 [Aristolochia fimbriata]|uniref:Zinc finger CHCC-type domain-containing protein n=1 Tax=Aristolochia fimbriata TaxID=158543 RepID=A0AAV7F006_ARIFI|nr:hypothetical protein H6P81_007321 [Aristolochia fimbriata]